MTLSRDKIVPQPVLLASEKDKMLGGGGGGGMYSKSFFNIQAIDIILQKLKILSNFRAR